MMKKGILVVLAGLALAVFAVPDAQGKSGPDVDQRLSGSTHVVDVDQETLNTTSLLSMQATGAPGRGYITGRLEWAPPSTPDNRCPPDFFAGAIISFEWVETFNDGSLLTGAIGSGQIICADATGVFTSVIAGPITGGTGRFEGAGGTWQAEASSPAENQGVTGSVMADLN
jgi:hypothetical protein